MKIESDTEMPPGGWRMTVAQTGVPLAAPYARALHKKVNSHLAANGYPPMGQEEFEDTACRQSGHGLPWCSGGPKVAKPPTTLSRVKQFLRATLELAKRRRFVSSEEHAHRMAICATCPLNSVEGLGCHGCLEDLRAVEKHTGRMPSGNVLTCRACSCISWIKCWYPNEALDAAEADHPPKYQEDHCWRLP